MREIADSPHRECYDVMGMIAVDAGDEPRAAAVVLEGGVVEGRQARRMSWTHVQYSFHKSPD